jgi:hypothetical protein
VAELTASKRLAGACLAFGDTVLEGSRDAVLAVDGCGLTGLGAEVGDGLVTVGKDWVVAAGCPAGTASAVSECDLPSTASKISSTTLTKTNPPTANFGQWPFWKSGMRGSLTAGPETVAPTGQRLAMGYRG